jgi:hypothetical protein
MVNEKNLFFAISPLYSEHKKTNLILSSFSNCNISNGSKILSVIKKFNFSPLKKKDSNKLLRLTKFLLKIFLKD